MKKVLLHICCGPCAIFPLELLRRDGFYVEGFFYNPNVQPLEEYEKRKEVMRMVRDVLRIDVHIGEYEQALYQEGTKEASDKNARCGACFQLRLSKAFQFATRNSFDYFTTSLLGSPYQDQGLIRQAGKTFSRDAATQFLFYDFRHGFRQAHAKARELDFYLQSYCGCLASKEERKREVVQKAPHNQKQEGSIRTKVGR